jgi:methylmalonyl-CoA mutase N-terminal domain/subunit
MGVIDSDARTGAVNGPDVAERLERQERELAELRSRLAEWEGAFGQLPSRQALFETISGVPVAPLYTPADLPAGWDYLDRLGLPGRFPFTRGPYTSMYRTRLWTKRQFAGFGTAGETNRRYHYLLDHGQTGLSVAFDFPTLMGYDSDHPRSLGEVGKCGVAISSLADMETLFDGIPLDQVSVSMTINGPAIMLFCFYVIAAEKQGVSADKLRGTVQNDILKEYMAQHAWIYPAEPALSLIVDMFEWCSAHAPKYNPISISGYHIREAGATAAQELAFTLRNGFEYVERGIARGLDVDDFAPRLSFFFDVHNDFFEEVAKFRAARRIWAKRLRDVYGAKREESWRLRTHAQTAGVSLVAQQPENNIVRVAYQALAAVLGGTQSLHTNSMDETLALPTEKSVRIALRTQQILAFETGIPNTIDPLAGSYFIESLTDRLEREAEEIFEEVEKFGGVVPGLESGYFQREIALSAERQQRAVESGEHTVVGVNAFTEGGDDSEIEILKIGDEPERQQRERLPALRASRDDATVRQTLERLSDAAREGRNVIEPMLDCVRAYCTLFEIRHALEEVYGSYREPIFF